MRCCALFVRLDLMVSRSRSGSTPMGTSASCLSREMSRCRRIRGGRSPMRCLGRLRRCLLPATFDEDGGVTLGEHVVAVLVLMVGVADASSGASKQWWCSAGAV